MGTVMKPVQNGRGRRRWWSGEQKLTVWIEHDNHQAPHSTLAVQSPDEFYGQWIVNTKQRSVPN